MPILPVVLWTDLLLFLLIGVAVAATVYVRRQPHLLAGWRRVGASPAGMAAATRARVLSRRRVARFAALPRGTRWRQVGETRQ